AAYGGPKQQRVEKAAAYPDSIHEMNRAALSQIEPVLSPCEDIRKDILAVTQLFPERICEGSLSLRPTWIADSHLHQFLRTCHGKEPEHDSIDQAEDGGVRTDAQGQGENRNHGEAAILAENSHGVAKILPDGFHRGFPARRANLFLDCRHAAHLHARRSHGFVTAHSGAHLVLDGLVEIGAQFLVHIAFGPVLAKERSNSAGEALQQ